MQPNVKCFGCINLRFVYIFILSGFLARIGRKTYISLMYQPFVDLLKYPRVLVLYDKYTGITLISCILSFY